MHQKNRQERMKKNLTVILSAPLGIAFWVLLNWDKRKEIPFLHCESYSTKGNYYFDGWTIGANLGVIFMATVICLIL